MCDDETCINPTLPCDGNNDCPDSSDEFPTNPDCTLTPSDRGDVLITEIMKDPEALSEAAGEYFEVFNPGAVFGWDLGGCEISSDDDLGHTIVGPVIVAPGGFAVLSRGANPGFVPDYDYDDIVFDNDADDHLTLNCGLTDIDAVAFSDAAGWPDDAGASMNLDPTAFHVIANDEEMAWCSSTLDLGNTDLGTPGTANEQCEPTAIEFMDADFDLCEAAINGGPNGFTLYTCYIPGLLHPVADDHAPDCIAGFGGADLEIAPVAFVGSDHSATICNATPANGTLQWIDGSDGTQLDCNEDALGETAGCAELVDSGAVGPPVSADFGATDVHVVIDEPVAGSYWDGSTLRVIELERG